MSGLGRLFSRIIPIITLVCFVCLGITHTFNQIGAENNTYLTNETINIGTQENPNNITYYNLDTTSYLKNINSNTLKRAVSNTIDTETFMDTYYSFNYIWQDGYDIGDITKTIGNAILLVINTIITTINIVILPIRIIAGLILTGISLIGIRTDTNGIITTGLKNILNIGGIPLIQPMIEYNDNTIDTSLVNTTWRWDEIVNWPPLEQNPSLIYQPIESNGQYYKGFSITYDNLGTRIYYTNTNDNNVTYIYQDGLWLIPECKVFKIRDTERNKTTSMRDVRYLKRTFLNRFCTRL